MIKNLLSFSFFTLLGMALLVSCAKPSTTPTNTTPSQFISATVNGTAISATNVVGVNNSGIVQVAGTINSASSLQIATSSSAPGTYPVSFAGINSIGYAKDLSTVYSSTSGSITISSFSNNVLTGTFQGECKNASGGNDSVAVTKGSFSVKIQ